ncbi:MAG: hypothetical protein ACUVXE_04570 [Anaerolineae bacterium]
MGEQNECCLRLTGGGDVLVQVGMAESGRTSVILEARERDYQAAQFMETI